MSHGCYTVSSREGSVCCRGFCDVGEMRPRVDDGSEKELVVLWRNWKR